MNPETRQSAKPILNWLGLGILVLIVVAIIRFSAGTRLATDQDEPETSTAAESPASVELLSPISADSNPVQPDVMLPALSTSLNSPLPSNPAAGPPLEAAPTNSFQLTVLHTNDTWGYLTPCG